MLRYRNKMTTAGVDQRIFNHIINNGNESARLNTSVNDDADWLRTPSSASVTANPASQKQWSHWQQMTKGNDFSNIKDGRFSQVSTSMRKPVQINAQSTTLLI
jgi:hypothetical protein